MSIDIIGLGVAVPKRVITNEELSKFIDTNDQWIRTRTGIESRHICEEEKLLDLSLKAATEALESSKVLAGELDLIVCATLQGDAITPNLACMLQGKLGAHCPAFDINAACSGFIYALDVAKNFILGSGYKKVLIVCADMLSRHVDWNDRATCVLFGDGAAACVVEPGKSLEYINLSSMGNDEFIHHKVTGGNCPFRENDKGEKLYLNGQEVYKFAIEACQNEIEKAFKVPGINSGSIDSFILHQANKRIIDTIRHHLNLPQEKFPLNIQKYGNTSAASIPILLYELTKDGRIKKGDRLLLTAFGGGLSSAASVITWTL